MAIAPFPHTYRATLDGNTLTASTAGTGDRDAVAIGPPPQFGGNGERDWSPEELLLGAVVSCFKTTFDAYLRRTALDVRDFHADVIGELDKSREGPVFTAVRLHVDADVAGGDEERVRVEELMARAERECIISRALKAPVTLDAHITAVQPMGSVQSW